MTDGHRDFRPDHIIAHPAVRIVGWIALWAFISVAILTLIL